MPIRIEHQLTNSHYTSISLRWTTPKRATCSWNNLGGKPLVSGSTIMKFVLICSMNTWRLWILSLITRNLKSTCFNFDELLLFLEYNSITLLSHFILNGLLISSTIHSSMIKFCNHILSFDASWQAIDYVFMIEVAMIDYLRFFHNTVPLVIMKTYLKLDLLLSRQLAKSKSKYPMISKWSNIRYVSMKYFVLCRYCKTLLTTL